MDDWGKFDETSLPEKEDIYSQLKCLKIYERDSPHILSAPGLKLDLLTDIDMLLMVEKGII